MAIRDADFDNEAELQAWSFENSQMFFGTSILLPGFRITTSAGKHAVPDGFCFNFDQRSWWIIECELLKHGVWQHIAEQITRFVVAARNPATLRQLRDRLFDKAYEGGKLEAVAKSLGTDTVRLMQQIELFLEGVSPSVAIFIDRTDQDLIDLCDALDIQSAIYEVKKFIVDGKAHYYSPNKSQPAITFDPAQEQQEGSTVFDVIEQLGGGEVLNGPRKCFKLSDGGVVKVQYSKFHDKHQAFWYGITPSSFSQVKALGCNAFVFILGETGFVRVPIGVVEEYLSTTYTTRNTDGSIRHYHVHISPPPDVVLMGYDNSPDKGLGSYFRPFG